MRWWLPPWPVTRHQTHHRVWFTCWGISTERKSCLCISSHCASDSPWGPGWLRPQTVGPRQFQGPGSRPKGAWGCVGPLPEIPRWQALHWGPCLACGAIQPPVGFWLGDPRPIHRSRPPYLQERRNQSGEEADPRFPRVILGWWPGNPWSCRPCDTQRSYRVSGRPTSSVSGGQLQSSRPAGPQRRYCAGAGLYHPHGCKFDRWPPASSRLDREALGAQRFHLWLHGGSFGTSWPRHHRLLLPSPGAGWQGLLRQLVSHLCLWRPVYCSGGGWMSFHLGSWRMTFHPGQRWTTFPPGLRWTFFHPNQRSVGLHPVAFQRLQLPESQFGSTSVGEVICWVGPRVP